MDSDMFFIKETDADTLYNHCAFAFVPQSRGDVLYAWNGLWYMDMSRVWDLKSLNWMDGVFKGQFCDAGGATTFWLDKKPSHATIHKMEFTHMESRDTWSPI